MIYLFITTILWCVYDLRICVRLNFSQTRPLVVVNILSFSLFQILFDPGVCLWWCKTVRGINDVNFFHFFSRLDAQQFSHGQIVTRHIWMICFGRRYTGVDEKYKYRRNQVFFRMFLFTPHFSLSQPIFINVERSVDTAALRRREEVRKNFFPKGNINISLLSNSSILVVQRLRKQPCWEILKKEIIIITMKKKNTCTCF